MKLKYWLLVILAIITMPLSYAESTATIVRDTAMLAEADAKAEVVANLKKSTQVAVSAREGGWYQVNAMEKTGWVRMFLLRFDPIDDLEERSGLGALLASTNKPHSNVTLTTGVRGITEKGIKNAKPNFVMLGEMSNFHVDKKQATSFAKAEKLKTRKVKYVKKEKK